MMESGAQLHHHLFHYQLFVSVKTTVMMGISLYHLTELTAPCTFVCSSQVHVVG